MRQVTLPSKAVLSITPAPFAAAKALYQAILRELKSVEFNMNVDKASLFKDLFCAGFSSLEVEACLDKCLERCTYDDGTGAMKIDKDTFEKVERRKDYLTVCAEVAKENAGPFGESLYAEFERALSMIDSILLSKSTMTVS